MVLMIFDGFDDFWGFEGFDSLFDQWAKGELDDGAWWSGFWLVADDGARSAVAVLDDGGLIVDGGLGCVWEDFQRERSVKGEGNNKKLENNECIIG